MDLSHVSIVVLSHNRRVDLEKNLEGLLSIVRLFGSELVIVDNASSDGSVELINSMTANVAGVKVVLNAQNLGVGGGRNSGWREASREFLLNLDDDAYITADAVYAMLSFMLANETVGIISPRILQMKTKGAQCDYGDEIASIANFHGACHMLRRAVVLKAGYNDELCAFGGEELDLSIRARAHGFDVLYTPVATVLHNSYIRETSLDADRRIRWVFNVVRVHHKHFPLWMAVKLSSRYLLSAILSGLRSHGLNVVARIIVSAIKGFYAGRAQHDTVPAGVSRFYSNGLLRPDFGNVPLHKKLSAKFMGSNAS